MATCFIPPDIVLRSVRQDCHSDFVTFLLSILDPVVVEDLVRVYQLGGGDVQAGRDFLPAGHGRFLQDGEDYEV